jgi:hypothetical protein
MVFACLHQAGRCKSNYSTGCKKTHAKSSALTTSNNKAVKMCIVIDGCLVSGFCLNAVLVPFVRFAAVGFGRGRNIGCSNRKERTDASALPLV